METKQASGFEELGLGEPVLSTLRELGYEEPTPIQKQSIPVLLAGKDLLGQAATGTGKTAAFALPMIERLDASERKPMAPRALVLAPTRELAIQVADAVKTYGKKKGIAVLPIFGGQEMFHQIRGLKMGVDVVVATPGRVLDHVARKTLKLADVQMLVLDEADEMLDMGFAEDLEKIFNELPQQRQTALFSATMPSRIVSIANSHLTNPEKISIAASASAGTLPNIRQEAYQVRRGEKEAALLRVLEIEDPKSALVFCRTRVEVDALTDALTRRGIGVGALHGGMTQEQRAMVLRRFKGGQVKVLIATDVAARGLHVDELSHVFNYDLPNSPESYVHRIGRTGRAGREGVALAFFEPREMKLLKNIERVTKKKIPVSPVPDANAVNKKRHVELSRQVSERMAAGASGQLSDLVNELASSSSMEAVAGAAMALLLERLFAPVTAVSAAPVVEEREQGGRPSFKDRKRSFGAESFPEPLRGFGDKGARRFGDRNRDRDGERGGERGGDRERGPRRFEERPSNKRERFEALDSNEVERLGKKYAEDSTARHAEAASAEAAVRSSPARASAPKRALTPRRSAPRASEATAETPVRSTPAHAAAPKRSAPSRREATAELGTASSENSVARLGGTGAPRRSAPTRGAPAGLKRYERLERSERPDSRSRSSGGKSMVWLFISLGKRAGLRPQDVVGAIANEAEINSKEIGEIHIDDENSRVQVPAMLAPKIVGSLYRSTLRGRRFRIDVDRAGGGAAAASQAPRHSDHKPSPRKFRRP